jgi:predicted homoserine dehydrogenase-like protein
MYKPFHLIGLELSVSVLSAALRNEPTGQSRAMRGTVASVAKSDLKAGTKLDGEGGYTVWGKAQPMHHARNALPIGLAHGTVLRRDILAGETISLSDVTGLHEDTTALYQSLTEG